MASNSNNAKLLRHIVAYEVPVCKLEILPSWERLAERERKYAHYFSQASWAGASVVMQQASTESYPIFQFLQSLFASAPTLTALKEEAIANGVTGEHFDQFVQYCVEFYGNLGNYKSFGDTKFVPQVDAEVVGKVVSGVAARNAKLVELWEACKNKMFSVADNELNVGFAPTGVSAYYSHGMTQEEAKLVGEFMKTKNIEAVNTRLFKTGENRYEVRFAAAHSKQDEVYEHNGTTIVFSFNDFATEMAAVASNLQQAREYAENDTQKKMLEKYIAHFQHGDINDHKDSQRFWIRDIGPIVETNIGFIETYRDPFGVRAEWEGFVAVVNKELSKKFGVLVDKAEELLRLMPYPPTFEKDVFQKPDFTSLEVLTFASSGVPAGINIPNYDDIRQTEGFKNVSLGNVLNAQVPNQPITFVSEEDSSLYEQLRGKAFEVQVGIHELLGHGSGKLFSEDEAGKKNFDSALLNPVTNQPITSWYKPGETYYSKFSVISSSYEECRAECSGIYLSTQPEILRIFGFEDAAVANDIMYINWLHMARAGLLGLEFYNPETKKWGQAHMQARYAILQVLLQAGQGFCELRTANNGDTYIWMDRTKILSVGAPAIGEFLKKINVYKTTADVETATEMYSKYTSVNESFTALRDVVLAKKLPRRVFVQPHTLIDPASGLVLLKEFDASPQGMIQSFLSRFPPQQ